MNGPVGRTDCGPAVRADELARDIERTGEEWNGEQWHAPLSSVRVQRVSLQRKRQSCLVTAMTRTLSGL